ncbi:MAG: energy-dependent translational throttle protein EttA [Planctomycetia bacterium]|nr:energy-dependent translational throttle protein EttA [Planctomycetia bacterium]
MPPPFIMQIERLSKAYEKKVVIKDISLSFYYGAKIGVLGANGSGKSTLLRIMAGVDTDFEGHLHHMPNCKIGYVPQEPQLDPEKDVKGCLDEAVQETRDLLRKHEEVGTKLEGKLDPDEMQEALDELQALQEKIDACNAWELDRQLEIAADALELPPMDAKVAVLSGGEKRRVALCKTLLQNPDLLLLDEPTNHLDAASVAWLERYLAEFKGSVIAVTHDRYFLDNVAGWILELDRGRGIPWQGNYTSWLEQKKKRLELEEKAEAQRQRTLDRELEWIRMSPRARQAKPKARIAAYEALLEQDAGEKSDELELRIPAGPKLGNQVLEAKNLKKGYGDRMLIDGLTLSLPPGGIIGVIGPNGAGKTTLMKMIVGLEKPDSGTIALGPSVELAYVDQTRDTLDPTKTVYAEISGGQDQFKAGGKWVNSRAYVGKFNFRGTDQQKVVGELSGGERNRVQLAKLLKRGANVIILDEPSNDLDVDTLRALEEGLLSFAGCAIVVSHDRWFLDRIATHILAFEGDGKVRWFEGNYQAYVAKRREEIGDDAERPRRIKYKKLTKA